jgi:sugar lactone lactonase YvrE
MRQTTASRSSGKGRRPSGRTGAVALFTALASAGVTQRASADSPRAIGDTRLFATVPYPGHPGGIAVDGQTVYVSTFNCCVVPDRAIDRYDAIFAYDLASGALLTDRPNPIQVPRMMPVATMGLAEQALDADGRLYAADMNGRIVRVDPLTGEQDDYATFPTNTNFSLTNMPGGVVFDAAGNLYVTDAAGPPVIWRVPPGGGEAEPWFVDLRLAGGGATANGGLSGIRIDPSGELLYFLVASGTVASGGSLAVYRLPLDDPDPARLEVFHRYEPGSVYPGGLAFGSSGKLYAVSLVSGVSILRPDGTEEFRFPINYLGDGLGSSCPVFLAFDGSGSLLVTNLACVGVLPDQNPQSWAVLDSWVNDTALPLARPSIP